MILRCSKRLSLVTAAVLAAACAVGCDQAGSGSGQPSGPGIPGLPGTDPPGTTPDVPPDPLANCPAAPSCDSAVSVDSSSPALLITDPTALAALPIDKVITQLIQLQGIDPADVPPEEVLQRLFDTMNDAAHARYSDVAHCDSPDNAPSVTKSGDTFTCPRPEGALASSGGLMKAGDPDSFFPVAVVNRFDLTPVDASTCGQYRIIYAKTSGLTDPDDRVFLIFEAALSNPSPGCLEACRPVTLFWKGLEGKSPADLAASLRTFFFTGIAGFKPGIHPLHYGFGVKDQGYGGTEPGQIRVSMHMNGGEWDMRELHADQDPTTFAPRFSPASVKNNPPAFLFDPQSAQGVDIGYAFRQQFMFGDLSGLAGYNKNGEQSLTKVQMFISPEFNGVESLLGGEKKNDYLTAATAQGDMSFIDQLQQQLDAWQFSASCPPGDPLDAEAVLARATALSCAGCHAPKDFLGADRAVGCGLTWPDSLGQTHVNEKSEISPALKDVFLPRRAEVLQTFLQSCDQNAIYENLQPTQGGQGGLK